VKGKERIMVNGEINIIIEKIEVNEMKREKK
jgi:hypothetical protein